MISVFTARQNEIAALLAAGGKTLTEIAQALQVTKPAAQKLLSRLESMGLVRSSMGTSPVGRVKHFSLRPFSMVVSHDPGKGGLLAFVSEGPLDPEYPLLGQIPQKEFRDAAGALVSAIACRARKKEFAVILYGSVARGEGNKKSDLDLIMVSSSWTKNEVSGFQDILADASFEAGYGPKPRFWTKAELLAGSDSLSRAVRKDGMILLSRGEVNDIWRSMEKYRNILR